MHLHENPLEFSESSSIFNGKRIRFLSLNYHCDHKFPVLCISRMRAFSLELIQDGFGQSISSVAKIKLKIFFHFLLLQFFKKFGYTWLQQLK